MVGVLESNSEADEFALRRKRRFRVVLASGSLLLIGGLVATAFLGRQQEPDPVEMMHRADQAFARGDIATAHRLAEQVLKLDPRHAQAMLMTGKCLDLAGNPSAAAKALLNVPAGEPPYSTESAKLAGDVLFLKLHRLSDAEASYRRALREDPASADVNDRLAVLLEVSGQWWRQIPARLAAIRGGKFTRLQLFGLALAENALVNPELIGPLRRTSPDDPLVLLAAARLAAEDEQHETAIALLNRALHHSPQLVQAHVLLGTIHFERGNKRQFGDWLRRLPPAADEHPGVWVLRGQWALRHSRQKIALRCFCEAVRRNANQPDALYQAGQILVAMKRTADAAAFLDRAKRLREFDNAAKAADSGDGLPELRRVAILAESLGNTWEAYAWSSLAAGHSSKPAWAEAIVARTKAKLSSLPLVRTAPEFNPVRTFDYHSLPLPVTTTARHSTVVQRIDRVPAGRIAFEDRAAAAGIHFRYVNGGRDVAKGTKHMYEVLGGGVAVLDVNGDLRPDLYVTQGGRWPVDETKFDHLDRLYVNRGDGRFDDVTEVSGIRENRFSQGVAVGDVDSDGFPDLLVGNIGRNRLYHNNGDGTFTDISNEAGLQRSDWTTSCAIVDLNGDGHPEIYLVNYLQGADVFTRACGSRNDGVCLPQHFRAADDRLLWNTGSGFRDVTETCGIKVGNGKGLGIVVGMFGRSSRPNIFVANDTVANFYFENQGPAGDGSPRFRETALVSGLAMNGAGRTQACMGVAAGDADGDGALDLFVTNFHGESNTLYRQRPDGLFDDETLLRRLHQPSLSRLGFGTQFLDADLDGRLDLIVANGHIDNYSRDGRTDYQMRPQFFQNVDNKWFHEVDAAVLGAYFDRKALGRSLARLDWNGDGKEDVVVSHLDAPLALLENTTLNTGGFLALHLRGVQSNRDAIGAIVRVEAGSRRLTRQLTAGDGFQASNERVLNIGLGDEKIVRKVTVNWPSGRRGVYHSIAANSRWIVVEGSERLLSVPKW